MCRHQYPNMKKAMGDFELQIIEGEFTDSEIMVMLGENGKTGLSYVWITLTNGFSIVCQDQGMHRHAGDVEADSFIQVGLDLACAY